MQASIRRRLRLTDDVGLLNMLKKVFKLIGKVLAILALIVSLLFLSSHFDIPPHRGNEASDMVRAEFGYGSQIRDSYFITYGFLQGVTCYYRFCASNEDIEKYIKEMELVETSPDSVFMNAAPYWWRPKKNDTTKFYRFSDNARRALYPVVCILSWDQKSNICHVRRVGG